ncbi:glucose-6-phosphate/phosphate translocator 2 [Quercus suber]|uniref:Glucose-6-phosphate/phosphate translocator 2 n=1 Tax=Quercus suber TaxID=58331 RepID=A0AAW0KID1_QUESU
MISSVKLTATSFTNRKLPLPKPQYFLQPTSQNSSVEQSARPTKLTSLGRWRLTLISRTSRLGWRRLRGSELVLNAFPYPWLTSTLSLATGSLMMLISWATRIADAPKTDLEFWKTLFPVAVAHTIGHVAATVSMSKVAVSFTHIIKSGEPAFSVLVSRFLLGDTFPVPVYLSLLPIIGGCALAAVTELNFNMTGFMGAMISNLAFVFRNIFSKKGMKGKSVSGMNYYACLSILSLLILTPFAIAVEGPKMWAAGWENAISQIGPHFIWWVAAQSVFYHLYNQVSYMSLDQISPLTFSIGNTMKRISVIVSSIIIFHTPVQPINALGAAIAILGTFLYSQAKL